MGAVPAADGFRGGDAHLALKLVHPAEEGAAELDGLRQFHLAVRERADRDLLAEFVEHRAAEFLREAERDGRLFSAEHPEDAAGVFRRGPVERLGAGGDRGTEHGDILHPVEAVGARGFFCAFHVGAQGQQVIVVLQDDQGIGLHRVRPAVVVQELFAAAGQVEVAEGEAGMFPQGRVAGGDVVKDPFVAVLSRVEKHGAFFQVFLLVDGYEGEKPAGKVFGLVLRDVAGGLHGVQQGLDLRQGKGLRIGKVSGIPPAGAGYDIAAAFGKSFHIGAQRFGGGMISGFFQPGKQFAAGELVIFIRLAAQDGAQLQDAAGRVGRGGHGVLLLCSVFHRGEPGSASL